MDLAKSGAASSDIGACLSWVEHSQSFLFRCSDAPMRTEHVKYSSARRKMDIWNHMDGTV